MMSERVTFSPIQFCRGLIFYSDVFTDVTHQASTQENSTDVSRNLSAASENPNKNIIPAEVVWYEREWPWTWLAVMMVTICSMGVVGNTLNLAILSRRKLLCSLDDLEKSSIYGLVGLALSDLLFCLAVLPCSFIGPPMNKERFAQVDNSYHLHYRIYGIGTINLWLMTSAWLIVVIAVNRLYVVQYPLQARSNLTGKKTIAMISSVYILSVFFTAPYYLHSRVMPCQTLDGIGILEIRSEWRQEIDDVIAVYIRWVWPVVANFLPLLILLVCNLRLIVCMKRIKLQRRASCRGQMLREGSQRVTLTLFGIIILFCILVCPAEILKYVDPYDSWGVLGHVIASIANLFQAVNFACNFVLYCVVNPHFRRTICTLFCKKTDTVMSLQKDSSQRSQLSQHSAEKTSVSQCELEHECLM